MKQIDLLSYVAWGMHYFGSFCIGGNCSRRDMIRARDKGLVKSIGQVATCDDDGFTIEPERYSEGFVLTEKGKAALREHDKYTAGLYL